MPRHWPFPFTWCHSMPCHSVTLVVVWCKTMSWPLLCCRMWYHAMVFTVSFDVMSYHAMPCHAIYLGVVQGHSVALVVTLGFRHDHNHHVVFVVRTMSWCAWCHDLSKEKGMVLLTALMVAARHRITIVRSSTFTAKIILLLRAQRNGEECGNYL